MIVLYTLQCICVAVFVITVLVSVGVMKLFEGKQLEIVVLKEGNKSCHEQLSELKAAYNEELSKLKAAYNEQKILCDAQKAHLSQELIGNAELEERNWWMKVVITIIALPIVSVMMIIMIRCYNTTVPQSNAILKLKL